MQTTFAQPQMTMLPQPQKNLYGQFGTHELLPNAIASEGPVFNKSAEKLLHEYQVELQAQL